MTITVNQLEEARRALEAPLFADLAGDANVSFEFFPPKTEKMEEALWETVKTLEPFGPRFVSVTYGAGGSTRERTHATVARIQRETSMGAAAHLTCAAISLAVGALWFVALRHLDRSEGVDTTRTRASAGAGALLGLVATLLHCRVVDADHLLLGHGLTVALLLTAHAVYRRVRRTFA
jgi:hypothetical protein